MRSTLWILCVGWAFIPAAGLRAEDKPAELRSIKVAANDFRDDRLQVNAMPPSERIRFAERLAPRRVPRRRSLVGPQEHILQQLDAIEFVHTEHALRVRCVRHGHERERRQIGANQGNVGGQS